MSRSGRENVPAVKRCRRRLEHDRRGSHLDGPRHAPERAPREREHAVVGADQEATGSGVKRDGPPPPADPGIDHCEQDGAVGKVGEGLPQQQGAAKDVAARNAVGKVDDLGAGSDPGDHAVTGPDELVLEAKV